MNIIERIEESKIDYIRKNNVEPDAINLGWNDYMEFEGYCYHNIDICGNIINKEDVAIMGLKINIVKKEHCLEVFKKEIED